jgi:hypothetical protein
LQTETILCGQPVTLTSCRRSKRERKLKQYCVVVHDVNVMSTVKEREREKKLKQYCVVVHDVNVMSTVKKREREREN